MEHNIEHGPLEGRYRHFKGGEYEVLGTANHSETGEELVVYRALYGERKLWVRPRAMFYRFGTPIFREDLRHVRVNLRN